jgi:hypothetical protein
MTKDEVVMFKETPGLVQRLTLPQKKSAGVSARAWVHPSSCQRLQERRRFQAPRSESQHDAAL